MKCSEENTCLEAASFRKKSCNGLPRAGEIPIAALRPFGQERRPPLLHAPAVTGGIVDERAVYIET